MAKLVAGKNPDRGDSWRVRWGLRVYEETDQHFFKKDTKKRETWAEIQHWNLYVSFQISTDYFGAPSAACEMLGCAARWAQSIKPSRRIELVAVAPGPHRGRFNSGFRFLFLSISSQKGPPYIDIDSFERVTRVVGSNHETCENIHLWI